jgi:hypothetical protein
MPKTKATGKSKAGRWAKKASNRNYSARRLRTKLKHVMHSCGMAFAEAWATRHAATALFLKMRNKA